MTICTYGLVNYHRNGDGTRHLQNAPHCLLLWRKLPPVLHRRKHVLTRRLGFLMFTGYIESAPHRAYLIFPHSNGDNKTSAAAVA